MDDNLEAAADELLRANGGFGRGAGVYSEDVLVRRARREVSLEELCASAGFQLPAPPPEVGKLISRAVRAELDRRSAFVWALTELGFTQTSISQALNCSPQAISRRLARIRARIADHIADNDAALLMFAESMRMPLPHKRPPRPPVPAEVQAARVILEAEGLETWILPDDSRRVLVLRNGEQIHALSYRGVVRMARDFERH